MSDQRAVPTAEELQAKVQKIIDDSVTDELMCMDDPGFHVALSARLVGFVQESLADSARALDAAQAERDLLATDYDQALQRAKRSEEKFTTAHQFIDARDRMIDAAQARIAAVESDRQRDAYEAGERLYAAERRAEVAEARIVELEAERVHVLKQSNALSVASKGLRTWVVKFQGQIRADIAEDVAQMTADIGEAERLVEQAETELGRANVAEDPGEAVFSHEIPPIAPGRRPAPQLNPNWPYEDRSVKVCRGCGRQTLTFHAEGCEVASYEVVLDADCAPVATPEETE